ncbi:MAG: aldehyde dehydrogenase family protein [Imperialibacter sp.]|uniref:aldehyde dehydrogenase family protein n=1 Tax=Imperialibacter sp. TaxID=2038411 RepID=UPI0032EA9FED
MQKGFQIISPVDGSVYAERSYATASEVDVVVAKSCYSFPSWRKTSLEKRAEICRKAVQYFVDHADDWGFEITMQMGRPVRYTPNEIKGGFKDRAEYMIASAFDALKDKEVSQKEGFKRFIRKEPLGTVLVLAPWNYPYLTSVNVVIPAIMAGNTVILKHAEQTALCAERYAEAFKAAGLPDGVFQFLHINHAQVADLIHDPRIAYVAFTGSVEGGRAIQEAAGDRFITAGLELGGKDPAYVREDADLAFAVENLVDGAFFNSGQSCCGIERIYVHQSKYDEFVKAFVELTKTYKVADPRKSDTTLGPMVRPSNMAKAQQQVKEAVAKGAKLLVSAIDFPEMSAPYLAPHVLVDVNHTMEIMSEESFAPIIGIMPVKDDNQAIRLMNDSQYGLAASIWTKDVDKALAIGNEVETGTWFMNRCDYLDPELAWTGVKNSGKGYTLSSLGYDALTRPKSFHLRVS